MKLFKREDPLELKIKKMIKFWLGLLDIATSGTVKGKTVVGLVYHEVSNTPCSLALDTSTFTSISVFKKQMKWIQKSFQVIEVKKIHETREKGKLILTFDDGYKSFKYNALPLISEMKFPVICFINSVTIYNGISSSALVALKSEATKGGFLWRNSNPLYFTKQTKLLGMEEKRSVKTYQGDYLNWEEIRELASNSLVLFGNHLVNHWYSPSLTEIELKVAIQSNKTDFLKITAMEEILAWPYGVTTENLSLVAYEEGMKIQMFGMHPPFVKNGPEMIVRVDMNDTVSNYTIFRGTLLLARLRSRVSGHQK